MKNVDVFLSRKSADAKYAKQIYDYLTAQGLEVFESDQTLKQVGNADYIKEIDAALAITTHLIVIGSSAENIKSSWVEAEWLFFLNRKRSGKTLGNLFTVITGDFKLEEVPASLANYEVIPFNKKNFPIIYNYTRKENTPAKQAPQKPINKQAQNKYLWFLSAFLLIVILGAFLYIKSQPYDATVFLIPDPALKINTNYPSFKGGDLSIYINNKQEKSQILANGEVVFKTLDESSKGKQVLIKMEAENWKLATDTILLSRSVKLNIIPDGSLGFITGNIKTQTGSTLSDVTIAIDNDTTITANENGIFNIKVPFKFQKPQYRLHFEREGYQPFDDYYYPKSGNYDVRMKKN